MKGNCKVEGMWVGVEGVEVEEEGEGAMRCDGGRVYGIFEEEKDGGMGE